MFEQLLGAFSHLRAGAEETVDKHHDHVKLQDAGISLGTQRRSDAEASETDIYTHTSPTYAEILKSLMVRSDNLFAEGFRQCCVPFSFPAPVPQGLCALCWDIP